MKIELELYGEAAEQYMKDKLSASIRRLMSGNDGTCEWDIALEIRRAFEQSHIVSEKHDEKPKDDAMLSVIEGLLRTNKNRRYKG